MARWRLMQPHYLNVPGNEWEYMETSQTTRKRARKVFEVPQLFDPKDPSDFNYPGEIIVSYADGAQHLDIIFVGDPTPDMEPLDAEAKALSEKLRPGWEHPIDSLPGQGVDYSMAILAKLEAMMQGKQPPSATSVDPDRVTALEQMVQQLIEQNAKLMAQLDLPEVAIDAQ